MPGREEWHVVFVHGRSIDTAAQPLRPWPLLTLLKLRPAPPTPPPPPRSCRSPDCRNERLYLGEEKRNGEVITAAGNKWSNVEYWEHVGLREYLPYMFGGGYAFSSDIARALHLANKASRPAAAGGGSGCRE